MRSSFTWFLTKIRRSAARPSLLKINFVLRLFFRRRVYQTSLTVSSRQRKPLQPGSFTGQFAVYSALYTLPMILAASDLRMPAECGVTWFEKPRQDHPANA